MGNPCAAVIYDDGLWAHQREYFGWESFDDRSQLNALQKNWREQHSGPR